MRRSRSQKDIAAACFASPDVPASLPTVHMNVTWPSISCPRERMRSMHSSIDAGGVRGVSAGISGPGTTGGRPLYFVLMCFLRW